MTKNTVLHYALIGVASLIVVGCAMHQPKDMGPGSTTEYHYEDRGEASGIRVHAVQKLINAGKEPQHFGMYTYILFNGSADFDEASISPAERKRFDEILAALGTTQNLKEVMAGATPPARGAINVFCVPVRQLNGGTNLQNYNFKVARQFLTFLQQKLATQKLVSKLNAPGPFLISTRAPLFQPSSGTTLLFADLSNQNPNAFRETLFEYKRRLTAGQFSDEAFFDPIRLRLVTWLLDANENVALVKTAIAEVVR